MPIANTADTLPFAGTICLNHRLPEDQPSAVGLVCCECKQHLIANPPRGRCVSFWEAQPAEFHIEGERCRVFTVAWDDFRIRSMHPPQTLDDLEGLARDVLSGRHFVDS